MRYLQGSYKNVAEELKLSLYIFQKTLLVNYFSDYTSPSLQVGNSSGWSVFDGSIDDIRIYNRVLTNEEIFFLSNN